MSFKLIGVVLLASAAFAQKLEVTSALGTKFYSTPDPKGTVAAAEKALAADPKNPDLILKLALAHSGVREYREAIETCTRGLKIAPDNAGLLLERGHREVGLRKFKEARADLDRAAKLDPNKLDVHYHLGLSHYFVGEFAEAGPAFRREAELAPTQDARINATNWVYASFRRAGKKNEADKAIAAITPEMKNTEAHTFFYLSLVRFFQGNMPEAEAVPPRPPAGNTDDETELRFDTVGYGVGNWYLYNGNQAKAQEYFAEVVKGHVWMTWGYIGSELEVARAKKSN
jgi:tetratricopeptide (TPR) repeat protein